MTRKKLCCECSNYFCSNCLPREQGCRTRTCSRWVWDYIHLLRNQKFDAVSQGAECCTKDLQWGATWWSCGWRTCSTSSPSGRSTSRPVLVSHPSWRSISIQRCHTINTKAWVGKWQVTPFITGRGIFTLLRNTSVVRSLPHCVDCCSSRSTSAVSRCYE